MKSDRESQLAYANQERQKNSSAVAESPFMSHFDTTVFRASFSQNSVFCFISHCELKR